MTLGPAAIKLAEAAGLFLDPWQQDALNTMLAVGPNGKWLCFECAEIVSRQNGKGAILEARVLAGFLLFGEKLIMWSAHEYKTAIELFLRVKGLIRNLIEAGEVDDDDIKVLHGNNPGRGFERLSTGQRITFIARSDGSGRGFSGDLNIVDEAYAYTRMQQSALMPTMSARPNPQIIYASSPPLSGTTGEILYALRERGDPTIERPPGAEPWQQDESLSYRDWGLAGELEALDDLDLSDESLRGPTNPALGAQRADGSGITRGFVAREFRAMSPIDFARERLGIWPRRVTEDEARAISTELWRDQVDGNPRHPLDRAFAVQVNAKRTHTAIAAVGPREDGTLLASLVAYQAGTHWVAAKLAALKAEWNPLVIAAQDKGPTGVLFTDFERVGLKQPEDRDEPERGDLVVPWAAEVAIAYGLMVDAVNQRRLFHVDDAPLNVALAGSKTRSLSGGTAWAFDTEADAAPLLAVTLAVWAWETLAEKVNEDYDVADSFA